MVHLETFLRSPKSIYERNWTISPLSLLAWGLKQLGLTGATSRDGALPVGQFVVISNVEVGPSCAGYMSKVTELRIRQPPVMSWIL